MMRKDAVSTRIIRYRLNIQQVILFNPWKYRVRYAQTIQTHNAVSVPLSNYSNGSWIDCDGFSDIGVTFVSDSNTLNSSISLHWSNDGSTKHGDETLVATSTPMLSKV
jgi:hypothetical protein